MMKTFDLGNNETKSIGVSGPHRNQSIPYLAMTFSESKWFMTRAGAVRWLKRRGYDENGGKIRGGDPHGSVVTFKDIQLVKKLGEF